MGRKVAGIYMEITIDGDSNDIRPQGDLIHGEYLTSVLDVT
jgi:hypothetical protein